MGPRVLVVDDDATVSDVVRRYLEREGFTVAMAADGPAALVSFADEPPDLVVFLVRHPGGGLRPAELLEQVWGWTFGDQSTVTVHMRRLREKVEDNPAEPRRILTVWGVGYRYEYA